MSDQIQDLNQPIESKASFLERIRQDFIQMVIELHLSNSILTKGIFLIDEFDRLQIETNMYSKSIAGGLVFFLAQKANIPVSKAKICTHFNIGKRTMRSVSEKFRKDPRFTQFFEKIS